MWFVDHLLFDVLCRKVLFWQHLLKLRGWDLLYDCWGNIIECVFELCSRNVFNNIGWDFVSCLHELQRGIFCKPQPPNMLFVEMIFHTNRMPSIS